MPSDELAGPFRRWGFLEAELDPLGRLEPYRHPTLEAIAGADTARWRRIYCGPIGAEFAHLSQPTRVEWIATKMEADPVAPDRRRLLWRLAAVELLERFLHRRYPGTKRYSLEGTATAVLFLDRLLQSSADAGAEVAILAMTHRGRLNVMVHIVGIPFAHIIAGFEDVDPSSVLGSGDVKYHEGATGIYETPSGRTLDVHLVSNPSHLEAVSPVAMGRARARQERLGTDGPAKVLPVTVHGDAAFSGQGIAAEALNLAGLRGFRVGGTVHLVVNNLIGFTTGPSSLHSARFATSVARRLEAPIFHVNGQDPEAVVRVASIAGEYRAEFGGDVIVDLIGFRRYGHSEVDDPTTTQPVLYRKIADLPMSWQTYADRIGLPEAERVSLEDDVNARLQVEIEAGRSMEQRPALRTMPPWWDGYVGGAYDASLEVDTAVAEQTIERIADRITATPHGFQVHPKVKRGLEHRREMGRGERPVDWGMAEALAFGSLLLEGTPVRLAGQDSRRGTFNHRHAVLFDFESGVEHVPLRQLSEDQARFDTYDTTLSEAAAMGFEYGFSRDYPEALVCWEAQFGDFANGAQIIIDQFVAGGEDKWGLLSGIVLLLPHGHEGQGPEHSSARLERFLALAAEDNIQICQPSTAAQYFHLLRRQARRRWRKPLVVFTPKRMLRASDAASSREDLTGGRFQPLLPAEEPDVDRLLLCTGKVTHELRRRKRERKRRRVGIVRLEQLYPFPEAELNSELQRHAGAELVWVQEEPANMGALRFVQPRLDRLARDRRFTTIKRSESASPATGSPAAHAIEQEALLQLALGGEG